MVLLDLVRAAIGLSSVIGWHKTCGGTGKFLVSCFNFLGISAIGDVFGSAIGNAMLRDHSLGISLSTPKVLDISDNFWLCTLGSEAGGTAGLADGCTSD